MLDVEQEEEERRKLIQEQERDSEDSKNFLCSRAFHYDISDDEDSSFQKKR